MRGNQQAFSAHVTCLSPIHIGTGEYFEPTNFTVHKGGLYVFDIADLASILTPEERNILLKIADDKKRPLIKIQAFLKNLSNAVLGIAKSSVLLSGTAEQEINNKLGKSMSSTAEADIVNKFQIPRTITNPIEHYAYIPGSSIKGSIRTALLNHLYKKDRPRMNFQTTKERKALAKYNNRLQNRLLRIKSTGVATTASDPFRLIKIGDALPDTEAVFTKVMYEVNVKKHPRNGGAKKVAMANLLHVIPAMTHRAFSFEITTLKGLKSIRVDEDLADKVPQIEFSLDDIIDACNSFYLAEFEREIEVLDKQGYVCEQWKIQIQKILSQYQKSFEQRKAMLLRVGKHSGAESVTIEGERMIKINLGNGQSVIRSASTTLWLASENSKKVTGLVPFGWILVEFTEDENKQLKEYCEHYQAKDRKRFQEMVSHRKAGLESYKQKMQEKREQEEARREQAYEEAKRTEERQRQLEEAQTPEARAILELRFFFEDEKKAGRLSRGGEVVNRLANLIKEAIASWPMDKRKQLAELAREIYKEIGVRPTPPRNPKVRLKKLLEE